MRTPTAFAAAAALALALAFALAGCGSGGRHGCASTGGTRAVERGATGTTHYLTGVSLSSSTCADRVAFTFEHRVPGYRVAYVPAGSAQTEDASGRHVAVAGTAFLVVRLADAATARSDGSTLTPTYTGARRLAAEGARRVREVVKTGDFEAVVTWAVGLDEKRPFSVSIAGDTLTLEID